MPVRANYRGVDELGRGVSAGRSGRRARLGSLVVGGTILVVATIVPAAQSASATTSPPQSNAVYRWGTYRGGTTANRQEVPTLVPGVSDVAALAAGNLASYALLTDGQEYAWGNGRYGQLGNDTRTPYATSPVEVQFPTGTFVTSIAEGNARAYAVDSDGNGWSWGKSGALCGARSGDVPSEIPVPKNLVAVAGASGHVLWLTTSGAVWECDNTGPPYEVAGLPSGDPAVTVSVGRNTMTVLLSGGQVWDWGQNTYGQLGDGTLTASLHVPVEVQLPSGTYATQIYGGGDDATDGHQVALLDTGQAVAWGNGRYGQLGNGLKVNEPLPVYVSTPAGVTFTDVVAGGSASYGIDTDGNLWAWGNNSFGQAGAGATHQHLYTPVKVDSGVGLIMSTAANVLDYHY